MSQALPEITSCEVCGNGTLVSVLDLGAHPMCDDLVEVGSARVCREYPIEILYCDACRTAHQRFQVPKAELFPSTYHYRSRFTADVLTGMDNFVASCARKLGTLEGRLVLDVGCNDGSLLDRFAAAGARTVGIEPTGAASDAAAKGHPTYQEFFGPEVAARILASEGVPDVITFTNVFAHIEDLAGVLDTLTRLSGPKTVVVIENHYLGSVLDGNQFDTFYHEHPRTYSYTSFRHIAKTLGMRVADVEFPSRYGGNIRVFLARPGVVQAGGTVDLDALDAREAGFHERLKELQRRIRRWQTVKKQSIEEMVREQGPLRAKAFPGRAAILVKLLGVDESLVSAVYEKPGSLKIGHYVPGTRIPIRSDDELFAEGGADRPVLNLAWHIATEIRSYLSAHGYTGAVTDILHESDFVEAR